MSLHYAIVAAASLPAATIQAQPPYYVAVPATPATKAQMMTRSTSWSLQNGSYVAARAPERDLVQCQLVARGAGPLQSFAVAGKAFDGDTLAECNAKAK